MKKVRVEYNGVEVKGIKKLLHLTIGEIIENYIVYPIIDLLIAVDKVLMRTYNKVKFIIRKGDVGK